jgi:hypothetical protein
MKAFISTFIAVLTLALAPAFAHAEDVKKDPPCESQDGTSLTAQPKPSVGGETKAEDTTTPNSGVAKDSPPRKP